MSLRVPDVLSTKGRFGRKGVAINFITKDDIKYLRSDIDISFYDFM